VTTPDPRDRALDGLLRRQLPDAAEASDVCLDAETLAAWVDGGLDAQAQTRVEAHAAGCARCQALMAAIVKSEPAPATAAEPWWNRWSLRWLVPLTAAAAAATLVWGIVPDRGSRPSPVEQELTQARAESTAPAAPADAPLAPPTAGEDKAPATPSTQASGRTAPAAPAAPSPAAPTGTGPPAETPAAIAAAPATPADARQEMAKQVAAEAPAALNETVGGERRSGEAAARKTAPAAPAVTAPAAGMAATARETFADSAVAPIINSRDPSVRWRLAGPGVVERSTDAGASWSRLETGVVAGLTAGASPSASVCWLAGRNGVVLLTTDARAWRRVASPTTEDLVAVDATDASTATVRAATGAAFRTTDGGVTWIATP